MGLRKFNPGTAVRPIKAESMHMAYRKRGGVWFIEWRASKNFNTPVAMRRALDTEAELIERIEALEQAAAAGTVPKPTHLKLRPYTPRKPDSATTKS